MAHPLFSYQPYVLVPELCTTLPQLQKGAVSHESRFQDILPMSPRGTTSPGELLTQLLEVRAVLHGPARQEHESRGCVSMGIALMRCGESIVWTGSGMCDTTARRMTAWITSQVALLLLELQNRCHGCC